MWAAVTGKNGTFFGFFEKNCILAQARATKIKPTVLSITVAVSCDNRKIIVSLS